MNINEVHIAGYAGGDAETKTGQTGMPYTRFSLCNTRKDKAGKEYTTWVNVTAFGAWTDTAKHVKKGNNVYVTGTLTVQDYEKDGVKKTSVGVMASQVGIIAKIERSSRSGDTLPPNTALDDIPF